ncbi:MAG: hypothetical protein U9N14_00180 [Pseudomonadota bacterium]|nr:hypothetical protein [Pseudomonadota bacterium]
MYNPFDPLDPARIPDYHEAILKTMADELGIDPNTSPTDMIITGKAKRGMCPLRDYGVYRAKVELDVDAMFAIRQARDAVETLRYLCKAGTIDDRQRIDRALGAMTKLAESAKHIAEFYAKTNDRVICIDQDLKDLPKSQKKHEKHVKEHNKKLVKAAHDRWPPRSNYPPQTIYDVDPAILARCLHYYDKIPDYCKKPGFNNLARIWYNLQNLKKTTADRKVDYETKALYRKIFAPRRDALREADRQIDGIIRHLEKHPPKGLVVSAGFVVKKRDTGPKDNFKPGM